MMKEFIIITQEAYEKNTLDLLIIVINVINQIAFVVKINQSLIVVIIMIDYIFMLIEDYLQCLFNY